ncbi:AAA family ATPase [Desulforamulus aeronauticus]|uniref:Nuclease SbcCD subunit C n=1 Tax=Desulforamulus aeronauticus DSM 10349 TaxID=1121421 RepID=A0A1M6QFI1_9FIRM|nr:AAA family ATPase [Desulforamulus aeronauticus]SHK18817.1 DNA repair exonuclease SbcCD ATPase subunit [Desulforamulus aeronauticus DSM 10349]
MVIKFKSIELNSFRAYKEAQLFDFETSKGIANLVVIYAPNGFGKTSFFDAVEWGFTGEIKRLTGNPSIKKVYQNEKGYVLKNIHSSRDNAVVKFITSDNQSISLETKKIDGKRKSDYAMGKIADGEELYNTLDKENFVQKNLLTHDQIDIFLRFKSSKEKYEALKSFWDFHQDSETFINIIKAKKDIEKALEALNKDIKNINKDIDRYKPSSNTINHINGLIKTFNDGKSEHKLEIISQDDLSEKIEVYYEVCNKLKAKIENDKENMEKTFNSLVRLKTSFNDYNSIVKIISEQEVKIKEFECKIKTCQELELKLREKETKDEKLKEVKSEIKDYEVIRQNLTSFRETNEKILNFYKEIEIFNNQVIKINQDIIKYQNKSLTEDNQIKLFSLEIQNICKDLEKVQEAIANLHHFSIKRFYEKRIKLIEKVKSLRKEQILILKNKAKRYLELINKNEFDGFSKIESTIVLSVWNKIDRITKEKNNLQIVLEEKKQQQLKLITLSNNISDLVKKGLDIIYSERLSICPLCNNEYKSLDDLISNISKHIEDHQKSDVLQSEIIELEKTIERFTKDLISEKDNFREVINAEVKQINLHIKKYEYKLDCLEIWLSKKKDKSFESQRIISTIQLNISALELINSDNEFDLMNSLTAHQQKLLSNKLPMEFQLKETNAHFEQINIILSNLKSEYNTTNKKINQLNDLINNLKNNEIYKITDELIYKHNLKIESLSELNTLINNSRYKHDQLNNQNLELNKNIFDLQNEVKNMDKSYYSQMRDNSLKEILSQNNFIKDYTTMYTSIIKDNEIKIDKVLERIEEFSAEIQTHNNLFVLINEILNNLDSVKRNSIWLQKYKDLKSRNNEFAKLKSLVDKGEHLAQIGKKHIEDRINHEFNLDTINSLYQRIEPHPEMRRILFELDESLEEEALGLNVYTYDNKLTQKEAPILYFSAAQVNILSLSIFLAGALESECNINTIFMDDPIQHLDSINMLSFIDLLRNITTSLDRQVIISTHDERFFNLVKKKIDPSYFNSKFIKLNSYGSVN